MRSSCCSSNGLIVVANDGVPSVGVMTPPDPSALPVGLFIAHDIDEPLESLESVRNFRPEIEQHLPMWHLRRSLCSKNDGRSRQHGHIRIDPAVRDEIDRRKLPKRKVDSVQQSRIADDHDLRTARGDSFSQEAAGVVHLVGGVEVKVDARHGDTAQDARVLRTALRGAETATPASASAAALARSTR